jgi:hypothetical protein
MYPIKKYLKKLILVCIILVFHTTTAQEQKENFWNNVRYGGGLGLNFSTGFFSATIAPSAIYEFNQTVAMGIGLNATFNNLKSRYKSTILGGSIIGLVNVIPEIQLSTEFENLNVDRRFNVNTGIPDDNYWVPALFLGAGYRSGNVTLGIRYDVLFDEDKSIYIDPWAPFVRFYF